MAYDQLKSAAKEGVEQQRRTVSRRSHLEIRMDILGTVMAGTQGPTQIMYRSNLSWAILSDELKSLTDLGLMEERTIGDRRKYAITARGLDILSSYQKVVKEIQMEPPVSVLAY
jgi:predicted transcriptional regulator